MLYELPSLRTQKKKKNKKFAYEHRHWTADDWAQVVFSDEAGFQLAIANVRTFIRRTSEEVFQADTIQRVGGGFKDIIVWGAVSVEGVGPLVKMEGKVNSIKYLDAFR